MPKYEIQVGDVVGLRSGGPRMTVADRDGESLTCRWFDEQVTDKHCAPTTAGGLPHTDTFPISQIELLHYCPDSSVEAV